MFVFYIVCLVVLCWLVVGRLARPRHDEREPPIIQSRIPFIGHIIGMIRYPKDYYARLRDKHNLPIATLQLPGVKLYVVSSVAIVQSVQKQSKALAFQPIQLKFSVMLCGVSQDAKATLENDADEENGEYGNIFTAMHPSLAPGATLNDMIRGVASRICEEVATLRPGSIVGLDHCLRHHASLAATDVLYGPHNPFKDGTVENAFWEFEPEIPKLFFLPGWLARHGARNRQIVADAFRDYYTNNHHRQATKLVNDFYDSGRSYGFSMSDRSLFEVGHTVATLTNTYAAVFWMVLHLFANPKALREVRREVAAIITTTNDRSGDEEQPHYILDVTKIVSQCPILVSTFKETTRLYSMGVSLRQVCKDTLVSETYLLKKGAMVLMPTISIHTDPQIWGSDVNSFNHRRFLRGDKKNVDISPAAYRSFGGGTTLCPGRHFAIAQVMVWTSMLIMRFDMEPVSNNGRWEMPSTEKSNVANVIMTPDYDVKVKLNVREGYQDGRWEVRVGEEDNLVNVAVEDLKKGAD